MSHAEQVEELSKLLVASTDLYQDREDSDPVIQLFIRLIETQARNSEVKP